MAALSAQTIMQLLSVSTKDKPNDDYEKMQFYYHSTIWAAVSTLPTLIESYRSTSSMCRSARCSLKSELGSCASLLRLFL